MGNTLSSLTNKVIPPDPKGDLGVGTLGKDDGSDPSGVPFYYPISNFFLNIICTINYWNYFQGCGPFNLSGCDDLATTLFNFNRESFVCSGSWYKMMWILMDIVGAILLVAVGTVGGVILNELNFIPQIIYDILSPLLSLGESIFGWVFSFFETGATYILQFLGFGGSIAGQSIFGLASDVSTAASSASGIPAFVFYIFAAEALVAVILKIAKEYESGSINSGYWICSNQRIYEFLDAPFSFLTDNIFPTGLIHDFMDLLFTPFRLLILLTALIVGTTYCDFSYYAATHWTGWNYDNYCSTGAKSPTCSNIKGAAIPHSSDARSTSA